MKGLIYTVPNEQGKFWEWRTDLPEPTVTPGHATVRVISTSINPVDYKIPGVPFVGKKRRGTPVGIDFSGIILDGGDTGFSAGEAVFGKAEAGSFAEVVSVPANGMARKPDGLSHTQAGSFYVAALTSLQALEKYGKLTEGGKVLIIGASGGTGGTGVQIAKAMGASEIWGVCSSGSKDLVMSLGATHTHDYNSGTAVPVDKVGHFDVVYDCVSSGEDYEYYHEAAPLLRAGGQYVAINGSTFSWVRYFLSNSTGFNFQKSNYHLFLTTPSPSGLEKLAAWAVEGKLASQIDTEAEFSDEGMQQAVDRLKSRRARGKVVIAIGQE